MIEFSDVYHAGVIVPNIDEAMPELASRFGVTWGEPRTVSVAILNNDRTVVPSIFLAGTFTQITMQLQEGFNKIAIKALNQGSLGANTAEFYIYDELGNLVYSNQWLLATGFEAQFVYVKESNN